MITFFIAIAILVLGYVFYGKFVERKFGASSQFITPAKRIEDGIDYKVLKPWKIYVIQFLNIAGLGPIFGAILGAAYGPVAYIWIVVGCVFMGATHDYFSGMLSVRNDGMSIPNIVSKYLGKRSKLLMNIFLSFLLIAVGATFVTGPADLLSQLTSSNKYLWLIIIFVYYIFATLLPIDKIIGKIYPFFGGLLIFMALSVAVVMIIKASSGDIVMAEFTIDSFRNYHYNPSDNLLIPSLFIVISCGAISGFHSTQSPIMARCLSDEKYGRPIFYGAMITEGIVAMIWATAAIAYFDGPEHLNTAAQGVYSADGVILSVAKTPAIIVNEICNSWLGKIGAIIAILGVVVCPITSGDTAFRSLRIMIADALKVNQKPIKNRLYIAIPIFLVAILACSFDFSTIWNYVGISNQVLATICLWTFAAYMTKQGKNHLFLSLPATFLTFVCVSYFLSAPIKAGGLHLNATISYISGIIVALALLITFLITHKRAKDIV